MTDRDISASKSTVRRVYNKEEYKIPYCTEGFLFVSLFVSEVYSKKRIQFKKTYVNKHISFWEHVTFQDKSKFNIFTDGRNMVW